MAAKSQRPKGQDGALSSLNVSIDALNLAKEDSNITPVKTAFGSAHDLLTEIRDSTFNKADYVELGLTCADVCQALSRGTDGRRTDQLSQSVLNAIEQLTKTVTDIQSEIIKRGKRNTVSRLFHTNDKEAIAIWRLDLNRVLHVFKTELGITTHTTTSDIRQHIANTQTIGSDFHRDIPIADTITPDVLRDVSKTRVIVSEVRNRVTNTCTTTSDTHRNTLRNREDSQNHVTHASAPGESPPPLPRSTHGADSKVHRDILNIATMVSDVQQNVLKIREDVDSQNRVSQISAAGESPPPPPGVFFGRDELIEKIIGCAERLRPIALIGPGGIGKTSAALTVLHDDRIKQRFGDNRWFIRCDEFSASRANFLRRLSKVIGAGIENPEDLAPLRPFLSSKEMVVVLDNAESILGVQGTSGREIYTVVDELSRFSNIWVCITSRISTVPPHCETFDIPTLSMEAARDTFYRIYTHCGHSDLVDGILGQLDFHPLSITLLATVAKHNKWDTKRLAKEWERRRTGVLDARHSGSLATTIELSLASPMFQELGPDARELLGMVAFFPQGVDEDNLDWLFPTVPHRTDIFDKFCILSLTHRNNGFTTMLAPLRDYFCPKDPESSPLLVTTKERYFARLSINLNPNKPGFRETQWITSEDVNVEHLLDVFTSTDANSENVWDACKNFMYHLYWHKPRLVVLGPKIEGLPDDHPSKAQCLQELSRSLNSIGNMVEQKRLLTHTLKLWRERGDDGWVAETLRFLSRANRRMKLYKEGIPQAKEASEIFERLGHTADQARSLINLALLLCDDKQLDAAEETAIHAIDLLSEKRQQFKLCLCHRVLGRIYRSKGEIEKANYHSEVALRIASPFDWYGQLFQIHYDLARLFLDQGRFEDAYTHVELAKLHTANNVYNLGYAMKLQATFWYNKHRLEEAKSEATCAIEVFEKLGAAKDAETCRKFLQRIDEETNSLVVSD